MDDNNLCHPLAAFLLHLLHESAGLRRLGDLLGSYVPLNRINTAAALAFIGTEKAKRVLLDHLRDRRFEQTHEARAALLELNDPAAWQAVQDWESQHGPLPEPKLETIEIEELTREVYNFRDLAIRNRPDDVRRAIEWWREYYDKLLKKWTVQ